MKIKNIPADIKSKSLKEARDEINKILVKLESNILDIESTEREFKRLVNLNKHIESLFREKSKDLSNNKEFKINDER
tara:strand:+ start:216 stop:446 length:231 start_codon:yes stop_codon:yes gene_type:complete